MNDFQGLARERLWAQLTSLQERLTLGLRELEVIVSGEKLGETGIIWEVTGYNADIFTGDEKAHRIVSVGLAVNYLLHMKITEALLNFICI